jgi:hypothetical protein
VPLLPEPATDRVDQYGRLLRYVIRASLERGFGGALREVAVGGRPLPVHSGPIAFRSSPPWGSRIFQYQTGPFFRCLR